MGVNKVMAKGEVVLDLTQDTVTPYTLATGAVAHNAAGDQIIGVGGLDVSAIDDTAGEGDYDVAWSAGKCFTETDQIKVFDSGITELVGIEKSPDSSKWKQGVWSISNGNGNASIIYAIREYSGYTDDDILAVKCTSDYKMRLQAWDENNTYIGAWNNDSKFIKTNSDVLYSKYINILYVRSNFPNYKFRISVFSADSSTSINVNDDLDNVTYIRKSIAIIDDTAGEGDTDIAWSADKLWKERLSVFHPEFRQGSFQSKSTATAITMQKTVKIGVFDTVRISIIHELEEGYSFRIRVIALDVDENVTYGYSVDSICANRWAFETDNNNLYINLAFIKKSGAKSIAIQFAIKDENGDLTNITPSDFADKITLELLNDTNYRYKKVLNDNEFFFDPDDFQTAVLSGSTGAVVFRGDTVRNRLSTKDLQYTKEDIKVIASNGYRFYVCYYNSADTLINNSNWQTQYIIPANSYYRIQFSNNDDSSQDSFIQTCDPLDLFYKFTYFKINNAVKISQRFPEMRNGGLATVGNLNGICTKNVISFSKANRIVFHFDIDLPNGATKYRYQLCGYRVSEGETENLTASISFKLYNHVTTERYFDVTNFVSQKHLTSFGVAVFAIDDANSYYPYRVSNVNTNNIWVEYHYDNIYESNDYLVDSCLQKRELSVQGIGMLTYGQSFCKYGDYYYSTNGTNIAKQDKDFAFVSEVTLNVGHGNGFQLGDSHYGYISGWDDNKIYKIDLDDLTLAETITLPTTGYTTSVVDERRGLIYIFRRESLPSTEEPYDYIVYDYINDAIIKNLPQYTIPFAAMQAADLYIDRIVVLNGTHSAGKPNGMRVYDLNGDLVAEYHLNTIGYEYEGVCIDRDSGELLISISYNNNVFVVKPI